MKRKFLVLMFAILLVFISGGCETAKVDDSAEINSQSSDTQEPAIEMYVLGNPNTFKKSSGSYTVTFEGARYPTADWSQTHVDHKVIFVDYAYHNIDYVRSDGTTLGIPQDAFIVADQNGVILNASYMVDDSRKALAAPVGTTCKASGSYIINSDVSDVTVKFKDGTTGGIVGEITMPVTQSN